MNPLKFITCFTALFISTFINAQETNLKAYNNYDFIPGETILFEDDFHDNQDGEFPARWDLLSGQAVVNKKDDKMVCLITDGGYGKIKPLIKAQNYLTDPFTVEFDFLKVDNAYDILLFFKDSEDESKAITYGHTVATNYFPVELSALYPKIEEPDFRNVWHHAALAYKNGQMKVYIDQHRVLVIPRCAFVPLEIEIGGLASQDGPLMFTNFKIASGGGMNMLGKILTDGKMATHAIKFDVNKSNIKSESMGFLNELVKWLKDNPAIKLEIGGHTDSDGEEASNLKLSQTRAEAVKTQLVSMGVESSRLSAKGYGETKPISDNSTTEGKANNRRVEFTKI